jgi:hypothetical protein
MNPENNISRENDSLKSEKSAENIFSNSRGGKRKNAGRKPLKELKNCIAHFQQHWPQYKW